MVRLYAVDNIKNRVFEICFIKLSCIDRFLVDYLISVLFKSNKMSPPFLLFYSLSFVQLRKNVFNLSF
ncbi:hypothetical protein MGSAQ_001016 [marine sediment metagenome]|uniref:Uncharacterized protein n=1 Tax=marine sediment metagenome TaxID=412755 RepID=A0A1B6NVK6_9ZZZZ